MAELVRRHTINSQFTIEDMVEELCHIFKGQPHHAIKAVFDQVNNNEGYPLTPAAFSSRLSQATTTAPQRVTDQAYATATKKHMTSLASRAAALAPAIMKNPDGSRMNLIQYMRMRSKKSANPPDSLPMLKEAGEMRGHREPGTRLKAKPDTYTDDELHALARVDEVKGGRCETAIDPIAELDRRGG